MTWINQNLPDGYAYDKEGRPQLIGAGREKAQREATVAAAREVKAQKQAKDHDHEGRER